MYSISLLLLYMLIDVFYFLSKIPIPVNKTLNMKSLLSNELNYIPRLPVFILEK